jgi:tetratricopeptide (TPR) repeat protein
MIVRFVLLVCMMLVAAVPARTAYADDPATRTARRHFERGEKLFALGKFDAALDEYQTAFDAKPLPAFLYNIGQCYRNLGDLEQAIFSFKKYLRLSPEAENKEAVERLIEDLEDQKARGDSEKFNRQQREEANKPIYSKWWFWTGVGVVAVAGGIGIYAATSGGNSAPMSDLGNIAFPR